MTTTKTPTLKRTHETKKGRSKRKYSLAERAMKVTRKWVNKAANIS